LIEHGIEFTSIHPDYAVSREQELTQWIEKCISLQSLDVGEISFIFTEDAYLLNVNKTYLNHDTLTDVITFDYSEKKIVSGDIFISIDRVRENAELYGAIFENELNRVMIHGVLHLCGYEDGTPESKAQMTDKEDYCLSLRDF